MLGPDGQQAGEISLKLDSTYEADLAGGHQKGPFIIAGSALMLYATEADVSDPIGATGLWTNLEVSGEELAYYLAGIGVTVTGRRERPTSLRSLTWGEVKSATF